MNKKSIVAVLLILVSLASAGCAGKTSSQGEKSGASNLPQPQVRVEALPSATPAPTLKVEAVVLPPTASATAPVLQYYIEPTPDEDAIANQIQSLIDEIDQKLQSQNFIFNP